MELIENLGSGPVVLREALGSAPNEFMALIPKAGGWSIRECMEHGALTEEYLFN
jgi:hypothetical protein